MCGVFVVAERGRPLDQPLFRASLARLGHRGPDAANVTFMTLPLGPAGTPLVSVGFGHTRLSILDLSAASDQPFARDASLLSYNGEIYNFRSLRHDLQAEGDAFSTAGDTEVLAALLARHGLDGLNAANGMWAFSWLDATTGQLVAARDRFGKKPLYYHLDATTLCIASEVAPIAAYLKQRPALHVAALDQYLATSWLFPGSAPATPFAGIDQVLPGEAATVDLQSWTLTRRSYVDPHWLSPPMPPPDEALPAVLRDAVLSRLVADRPVGLLLSGGIDSSLILSILVAEGLADRIYCFTGDAGKSEDAAYARACIAAFGIKCETVPLNYGTGAFDRFLDVCRHQEKPFPLIGNVLGMPEMYEAIAASGVPVVLDGTGGDEIFGGYWERYYRFAILEAVQAGDDAWLQETEQANAAQPRLSGILRATRAALAGGYWPPHGTPGSAEPPEVAAAITRYCRPGSAQAGPADPLVAYSGPLSGALKLDATAGRMQEWLWQNDRNAMRSSVENRSPFLDYRLAPFMGSGAARQFTGPWNKHQLRQAFDAFRPAPTQWRRDKQGFRWAFGRFLTAHATTVAELIAASTMLQARCNMPLFLDDLRADPELIYNDLTHRFLCVAALEAANGLCLR
jgi:asparagine synthase (glutamine-hydrolysing)